MLKQANNKQTFLQMIISSFHEPYTNAAKSLLAKHFKVIRTYHLVAHFPMLLSNQ